ncbi:polyphenol oxidase family protein [Georgenia thermotolerans]|uniref:polyphenol oxidase family protein n=1 Tax=Georgenia thermotolerans TaxID=527326 RepID=UPI002011B806|nr:polyphenol oxidase family protein [Georgenia thermotolerans]
MSPAEDLVQLLPADLGPGARGGFTARAGGVSGGPFAGETGGGLNLGLHVGDDPAAVLANRERVAAALGAPVGWMDQVHGAVVRVLDGAPDPRTEGECDGLVARAGTAGPVAAGVLVADCVPVLLAAADGSAVAAVHVGRQGLVRGVLPAALDRLAELGVPAAALHAAVGPSICGRCYEVPAALREDVAAQVPGTATTTAWGTPALDLPAGVLGQLAARGVTRVHHLAACTREDERFYSYRRAGEREAGTTGRFAGVVRTAA